MTKAELVERLNLFPDDTIIRVTNLGQRQARDIITILVSEDDEAMIEVDCEFFE